MSEAEHEKQQLLEFLYACPVGLVECNSLGSINTINPHAMKHLLPLAGTRDIDNLFAILEGCAPELRNLCDSFRAKRGAVCDGHRILVDIGTGYAGADSKTLSCTIVKITDDRMIATFTDITAQVAQEGRLKQAETWFASLLNDVNDYATLSITADGVVDGVNASFTRQTGHERKDVVGHLLQTVLSSDQASGSLSLTDQLRIAKRDGWYLEESWQARQDGTRYWCQRLFAARMNDDNESLIGYSVVLRDVVQQVSDTATLRRLLTRDHLTGAVNRTHFLQLFEQEQKRWRKSGQPLSLVLIDIDHFKAVNDRYGHALGDIVLHRFSEACTAALRPTDLLARIGGEEFAALLPNTTLAGAIGVAERMREAVEAMNIETPGGVLMVTASFGCGSAADADGRIERLMKLADDQLYEAKRLGRNRVCAGLAASTVA